MKTKVYLRPLQMEDAQTSYKWRNEPEIWTFSKFRPVSPITLEIEKKWLFNCLNKTNEYRRAICVEETDQYIGNVQIVDIAGSKGVFHLFIGEKEYWGKGIGKEVTRQILDVGFQQLKLDLVWLEVHTGNAAAAAIYKNMGFSECGNNGDFIEMALTRYDYVTRRETPEKKPINT